jgi:Cys-tRNA(Pro)/Cys-tRNA(Cys) deacylase
MMSFKKTNATRLLDKFNIDYQIIAYKVNLADLSAEHVSREIDIPLNQVFKTLVAHGDKTGEMVASIPGDSELDLKSLAQQSGNKKIHLIPVKEINQKTGYVRGGVSPLGLKHSYPLYIDQSALQHPFILISAGLRGLQIKIKPQDLITACHMKIGSLTQ